jgi:RNA polymerase sigma-70 factor (ECF subfamily)
MDMMNNPANISLAGESGTDTPLAVVENAFTAVDLNQPRSDLYSLLSCCLRFRSELLWTEFIRRTRPVIAGFVMKTMQRWKRPTSSLIDDLTQETYVKLFSRDAKALRRFVCHHENSFQGFLKRVAASVVQDHFRCSFSQKRGRGYEGEDLEGVSLRTRGNGGIGRGASSTAAIQDLERHILLQQIETHLLRSVDEPTCARDWTIFWLYYREGQTAKAIACNSSIGLTAKGVESTLLRLTRMVRIRMNKTAPKTAAPLRRALR